MVRLSHSALEKYRVCPAQWKYHYVDKLREEGLGSALLFGGAIDEAINVLLLRKKKNLTKEEAELVKADPKAAFEYYFTKTKIGSEPESQNITTHYLMNYYKSDFDADLLEEDDFLRLDLFIKNAGYGPITPLELYDEILADIKDEVPLDLTNQCYYNYCCWLSLRRKGLMMIEVYEDEILPQIEEVFSIQRKVELPNEEGDEYIGYIDFEASFVGREGIYTCDNKTSSKKYKQSDIIDKQQLVGYDEFTENGKGAYIVLLKKVKKTKHKTCLTCGTETSRAVKTCAEIDNGMRCGGEFDETEISLKIEHQLLFDDIGEEEKDLLFEEIGDILEDIKEEKFPQDRNECFQYGKKCIYFDYCREGKTDGLIRSK